jgi:hypothetical protein
MSNDSPFRLNRKKVNKEPSSFKKLYNEVKVNDLIYDDKSLKNLKFKSNQYENHKPWFDMYNENVIDDYDFDDDDYCNDNNDINPGARL